MPSPDPLNRVADLLLTWEEQWPDVPSVDERALAILAALAEPTTPTWSDEPAVDTQTPGDDLDAAHERLEGLRDA